MKLDSHTINEAAKELIEELGASKLTLQLLAERLGVKAPSLYNHIDSLQSLRESVALSFLGDLGAALRDAAIGRAQDEALRQMARAYRSFARAHPELYKAMLALENAIREEGQSMLGAFYQVLEPYGLGDDGMRHFARAFRSALHGFVSLEELSFKGGLSADESYERLVDALIASLKSFDWGHR
jgi:Transcriptional regulator